MRAHLVPDNAVLVWDGRLTAEAEMSRIFFMEKATPEEDNTSSATTSAKVEGLSTFEAKALRLIHETRGLLSLLKSVKGLEVGGKDGQLYRITLKRFRDNCLKLAAFMEACSLISGVGERDRILRKAGVGWDPAKKRVLLG